MLDTLTFLLEKLFLLAHIQLSSLLSPLDAARADPPLTSRCDRDDPPPQPAGSGPGSGPGSGSSSQLARGDLLEVPRTLFTHFGIYLGEGRVAHLIPDALPAVTADSSRILAPVTNTRLLLGVLSKRASIRTDSVEDFAYGAAVLPNLLDRTIPPLSGEEAARRAERLLGAVTYSLLWNNCEHFVTHCRYGAARSLQTEQFCAWLKSLIQDQRSVLVAALLGLLTVACLGTSPGTVLPALLIPFTLWMVS